MKHFKNISLIATLMLAWGQAAHAVEVAQGGIGGAVHVPFYSAYESNTSLLTIRRQGLGGPTAIKLLFEDQDGVNVTAFNLYMDAKDIWTMALADNGDHAMAIPRGEGCVLSAEDLSGNAFNGAMLPKVGRITIIEMGYTNLPGQPENCDSFRSAWEPEGVWREDPSFGIETGFGSLSVELQIVDGTDGTSFTVPSLVLDDFSDITLHSPPEAVTPNLASANSADSAHPGGAITRHFDSDGNPVMWDWPNAYEAVSSLITTRGASTFFSRQASINAVTEWIFAAPLQKYYSEDRQERNVVAYKVSDREGRYGDPGCGVLEPPLCTDSSFYVDPSLRVLTTDSASAFGISNVSSFDEFRSTVGESGWIRFWTVDNSVSLTSPDGDPIRGLPYLVIPIQKYRNETLTLENGETVIANYGNILEVYTHR